MAQITMSLEEYTALTDARRHAEIEAAVLREQAKTAAIGDPKGQVAQLIAQARHMLTVCRFAVANLPPTEVRGWPTDALRTIARALPSMPDFDIDDGDLMGEWLAFADEADAAARARAQKLQSLTESGK